MQKYTILFYDKPDGSEPIKQFLLELDPKLRAKVMMLIELLACNGPALREPYSKPLGEGLFELRAKVGSNASRVIYFFFSGRQVILTNGFLKKTPKTPTAELTLARKYKAEFLSRKGNAQ